MIKIIDELYSFYEVENFLEEIAFRHPMFYNGTFSENNEFQPKKPDKLMTKDELILKLGTEPSNYRYMVVFDYLCYLSSKNINNDL